MVSEKFLRWGEGGRTGEVEEGGGVEGNGGFPPFDVEEASSPVRRF